MKYLKQLLPNLLVLFILLIPILGYAQTSPPEKPGLVPCVDGKVCDFNMLMQLIDNVIKFVLFQLAVPIAAIMFFYAGFIMVTSGGDKSEARTKAKSIFFNTVWGLVLAIAAWLIVRTVLSILGYKGGWIGF